MNKNAQGFVGIGILAAIMAWGVVINRYCTKMVREQQMLGQQVDFGVQMCLDPDATAPAAPTSAQERLMDEALHAPGTQFLGEGQYKQLPQPHKTLRKSPRRSKERVDASKIDDGGVIPAVTHGVYTPHIDLPSGRSLRMLARRGPFLIFSPPVEARAATREGCPYQIGTADFRYYCIIMTVYRHSYLNPSGEVEGSPQSMTLAEVDRALGAAQGLDHQVRTGALQGAAYQRQQRYLERLNCKFNSAATNCASLPPEAWDYPKK